MTETQEKFQEIKQKYKEEMKLKSQEIFNELGKGEHYLYLIKMSGTSWVKIGISNNYKNRLKNLQTSSPKTLKLVAVIKTDYATIYEKILHCHYNNLKMQGEWFNFKDKEKLLNRYKNYPIKTLKAELKKYIEYKTPYKFICQVNGLPKINFFIQLEEDN